MLKLHKFMFVHLIKELLGELMNLDNRQGIVNITKKLHYLDIQR